MSVSVTWRLTKRSNHAFKHGTSSEFDKLCKAFPDRIICSEDVPILRAMAVVAEPYHAFFEEVADTVEKHGDIVFEAEY